MRDMPDTSTPGTFMSGVGTAVCKLSFGKHSDCAACRLIEAKNRRIRGIRGGDEDLFMEEEKNAPENANTEKRNIANNDLEKNLNEVWKKNTAK